MARLGAVNDADWVLALLSVTPPEDTVVLPVASVTCTQA